jgi:cytochrome c oxidase subunit IV
MADTAEEKLAQQPRTITYLVIAGILTALTAMEILVYNVRALAPVLVPLLLILMVAKFALVAMFYMHLRFDPRLFSAVFLVLLFFAGFVMLALPLLFFYHSTVHHG